MGHAWHNHCDLGSSGQELKKSQVRKVAEHLKARWQEKYMYRKSQSQLLMKSVKQVNVGNLIYVGNPRMKRQHWKLFVTQLYPGKDGLIRVAEVKIGTKTFIRSL